ncbi:hypothetical protein OG402_40100 [Streptomyces anulatus]|uniref:hypothetical protein n=1 Tax=Streptomyces anulatus TaxID=1892 RepID=UPI00225340DF|nr:hypothetical protein [Streptomyces anulatus]MCX4523856.1 hypothetical protein [Streptomyces anulatus]MCX4606634.1 hypothetical protein [Streptomyces anulatus]WSU79038.1 hypothetical protein OG499_39435 [Streptomyces anulatus]WTD15271.1 hypothetical protein OHA54_39035 [Streptomyces anulatus]WTE08677.1 hypothetical protein OH765_39700 [Streptomyces anulatus]
MSEVIACDLDCIRAYRADLEAVVPAPVPLAAGDDQATANSVQFFRPGHEGPGGVLGYQARGRIDQVAVPGDRLGQDFPFRDFIVLPVGCEVVEPGNACGGGKVGVQGADC